MLIDKLNLNHLRVFECVYRNRSMTKAAKELHLTQSGVSQHIGALEGVLEIKLFDRIKKRLVPTQPAERLFKRSFDSLQSIEQALTDLKGGEQRLTGSVAIGMPIEFGNNVVMPLLAEFCEKHPLVQLSVTYGFANEMNDSLLNGRLDFAFVDRFAMDRRIEVMPVYDEDLVLCASQRFLKRRLGAAAKSPERMKPSDRKRYFESLEYVDYQPGEPVLRMWLDHHVGDSGLALDVRAILMDVQGVARLVTSGLAAGVLPGHLAERLRSEDSSFVSFEGSGKPLHNRISLAYLPERTTSAAARAMRESLIKSFKKGKR